ncbi:MAG: HAD family hydrolase [Chloroflexota bacterium]
MSEAYSDSSDGTLQRTGGRRFRTVLFDLYDTLIWLDVRKSNEGRRRLADRMGIPLESFVAVWRRSVDDRMIGRGGGLADHLSATAAALGLVPDPTLVADLVAIERHRLEESVHLYPGTVPFLRRLRAAGYRLGLLSNASDGAAIPITHLGIDRLFDELVLSHEVELLKPDPAIYQLACLRLQTPPEETMFVADGGFGELDAAQQMGIFSVLVEQDHQSKEYGASTHYDMKIRHLRDLEPILLPFDHPKP